MKLCIQMTYHFKGDDIMTEKEILKVIKTNTILKERYDLLINFILEHVALRYNDTSNLRISDDCAVMDLVKTLELEKYKKKLKEMSKENF